MIVIQYDIEDLPVVVVFTVVFNVSAMKTFIVALWVVPITLQVYAPESEDRGSEIIRVDTRDGTRSLLPSTALFGVPFLNVIWYLLLSLSILWPLGVSQMRRLSGLMN